MGTIDDLHVQGIPNGIDEQTLKAIFSQYGGVAHCQLLDAVPGQADRAALLRMNTAAEANWIRDNINGNIPVGLASPLSIQCIRPQHTSMTTMPPSLAPNGGGKKLQTGVLLPGTVRRWNITKGFGFIVPDGGGPDVFVHARELGEGEVLVQGSHVMFEATEDSAKGPGMYRAKRCEGGVQKAQVAEATPATDNLFVTGLPMDLTEETIQAIFGQYGTVASVKKLPTSAGRNDTAALVRMGDVEQAKWLVVNVNGNIPSGLTTPVSIAYAERKGQIAVSVAPPAFGAAGFVRQPPAASGPYGIG